jgi:two-component system C4-dicarboxylate transport response regulator DctD
MIVYIDDEAMLCRVFRKIVEEVGIEVVTFSDPSAAVEYLRTHPAKMIICDYRMPAMNGLQLLEQLAPLDPAPPFFLVTGDPGVIAMIKHNPRVTGYLAKPFMPEELLALVSTGAAPPPAS